MVNKNKQIEKQTNDRAKCSNDPYLPYLQDFSTIISLSRSVIAKLYATSGHFTAEWLHRFHLSRKPVALNTGQGNSNWHQTVEFSNVNRHVKLKKKCS